MARKEFSQKTRKAAFARCCQPDGVPKCEGCGRSLVGHPFDYDHIVPDGLGGDNSLENCKVLCSGGRATCHGIKTHEEDTPRMRKADAQADYARGTTRKKVKIPQPPRAPRRPSKELPPRRPLFRQAS